MSRQLGDDTLVGADQHHIYFSLDYDVTTEKINVVEMVKERWNIDITTMPTLEEWEVYAIEEQQVDLLDWEDVLENTNPMHEVLEVDGDEESMFYFEEMAANRRLK